MSNALSDIVPRLAQRHQVVGWWGLFVFLTLGLALETLHGFKVGFYLDPAHKMRRLMWTLAHAHGTLLALINIAFAFAVPHFQTWTAKRLRAASFFMFDALVLLPLGFFLGGVTHTEVDPSPGVLLVPVGGVCLLLGVALTAYTASQKRS